MASPFTAYLAGVGTVIVALAAGFGGALILVSSSPSEREQKSAYEKRIEAARDKPVVVSAEPHEKEQAASPVPPSSIMTAATTPNITTSFGAPVAPAPWPGSQPATQVAPDPGMMQVPARPAPPPEATPSASAPEQPVAKPRDTRRERVAEPARESKKNDRREQVLQKKSQRKQIVESETVGRSPAVPDDDLVETRTITTYEPERPRAPVGIFNLLTGDGE